MKTIVHASDFQVNRLKEQANAVLHVKEPVEVNRLKLVKPDKRSRSALPASPCRIKHGMQKKYTIHIKNMVSDRCKIVVKAVLENLGLPYHSVDLGIAELAENPNELKLGLLKSALLKIGLELMDDKKNILVEKIKILVVETTHKEDGMPKARFSEYLSQQLNYAYSYLSNLFSEVQGSTIEHFILAHKIERVKELLCYDELTLSEIAFKLQYSSLAHLSSQFKKMTGLTPSHYKKMKQKRRIALENV